MLDLGSDGSTRDGRLTPDGNWVHVLSSGGAPQRRALFLDRDGVIIYDRNYIADPEQVELIPGAAETIRAARRLGMAVVIVTNQSGIGRGYFGWPQYAAVENRLLELLRAQGATVDLVLACPYHPEGQAPFDRDDDWRKPHPGMMIEAQRLLGLDLSRSILVGDKTSDVEAARLAGLPRAIYVGTAHGPADRDNAGTLKTKDFHVWRRDSIADIGRCDLTAPPHITRASQAVCENDG